MPGDAEALWQVLLVTQRTARHLEDLAAGGAVKMVVMFLARDFIPVGLAGNGDRGQPLLFHQAADVAVDGREADAGYILPGVVQDLLGRKGTVGIQKRGADRVLLPGLPCPNQQCSAQCPLRVRAARTLGYSGPKWIVTLGGLDDATLKCQPQR